MTEGIRSTRLFGETGPYYFLQELGGFKVGDIVRRKGYETKYKILILVKLLKEGDVQYDVGVMYKEGSEEKRQNGYADEWIELNGLDREKYKCMLGINLSNLEHISECNKCIYECKSKEKCDLYTEESQ